MFLIQLLLPLYDNQKQEFSRQQFDDVRTRLTDKFGGVTAFLQSPAVGLWKESDTDVSRDDVVMFEVMAEELDETWWAEYRQSLEEIFRQDEVLIRATQVRKL